MSETTEKIIVKRLHTEFEERNLLGKFQTGIRPGRSTTDSLLYLLEENQLGFTQRQNTVQHVYFSILKNLSIASPVTILHALYQIELNGNLIHFVHNFLVTTKLPHSHWTNLLNHPNSGNWNTSEVSLESSPFYYRQEIPSRKKYNIQLNIYFMQII